MDYDYSGNCSDMILNTLFTALCEDT